MKTWITNAAIETGRIALEMAPYIVLGLVAAVLIYAAFPKGQIFRWLGRRGIGSIIKGALAGIPLPLCSCGVVPVAMTLRRSGASDGATVSFLVSEPETGPDSIAVTWALINPLMTVLRPVAALVTATATGLAVERFAPRKAVFETDRTNGAERTDSSWAARLRGSFDYVMKDFLPDIANWLVVGIVLSGVLAVIIPDNWFERIGSFTQMVMGVVVGVPLYICASASTPIAAVFLAKGMSPGAALVFLLVGPATNAASFAVIVRELGARAATVYLAGMIITAVLLGVLVDATMGSWDWTPRIALVAADERIGIWHWAGLAALVAALGSVWWRQLRKSRLFAAAG
ncbi:MAG TPA: permease [bacterium]|nr:permease [bacterium]